MTRNCITLFALAIALCAQHASAEKSDTDAGLMGVKGLIINYTDHDREVVMLGEDLFFAINAVGVDKPYLYPVIGPTGANMTRHFPMKKGMEGESEDHPHHTSLWFTHGGVNGIDFWHSQKGAGTVLTTGYQGGQRNGIDYIEASDQWLKPDKSQLADARTRYRFGVLEDGSRFIGHQTTIQPAKGIDQLVFADTKEGTMAIRLAPQLRLKGEVATGKAINSEGVTGKEIWGKRARWVAYWGVIDGKTCGVAIFDHPTNLRHPTWWHARDYGLVAANPFGISDFEKKPKGTGDYTLKQGETLDLRYRFVFFAGTAKEADIAGKYDQWVKETTDTAAAGDADGWTPLFNGKDLTGWSAKPGGEWRVVDGAIVGTSEATEKRYGLLVCDQVYGDFEARLKFKVTHGNSGFYFRSTPIDHVAGIKGFQAEVDKTLATGGLYETLGRAWVIKPDTEQMKKLYTPGQWTDMTVRAVGGAVSVSVNGEQVASLQDDPGARKGHFALQLHAGQQMDVAFKDIAVRAIKAD